MSSSRLSAGRNFAQNASAIAVEPLNASSVHAASPESFRDWFAEHFSLDGKPYTLDLDQARAVLDNHKNTLVTARAGSGKTRVIVAKIAYLLATRQLAAHEIAAFMFNRTAAAEVNQRIAKVEFDGRAIEEIIGAAQDSAASMAQNDASVSASMAQPKSHTVEAARTTKIAQAAQPISIASTFHKFALDIVKLTGARPELISEAEHDRIVKESLRQALTQQKRHVSPREFDELLKIVSGFIARAGQKYFGVEGLSKLREAVMRATGADIRTSPNTQANLDTNTDSSSRTDSNTQAGSEKARLHQLALASYENYLSALRPPKLDFNIMMAEAGDLLLEAASLAAAKTANADVATFNTVASAGATHAAAGANSQAQLSAPSRLAPILARTAPLKLILIDEYQDFSQLFLNLIQSLRRVCPEAHLFAVGDDWQAINRFAGSDVDYFINFAKHFPEDATNIPLMTNYRSCRRVVENANDYMLKYYDPSASRAVPFNRQPGKIIRQNPTKTRFDASDIHEDALGDARYQLALARAAAELEKDTAKVSIRQHAAGDHAAKPSAETAKTAAKVPAEAARLLKTVAKILHRNHNSEIMLLHRHNFTTFIGVSLEAFHRALRILAAEEGIMDSGTFDQKVRCMTIHKSKGLEADVVILLEANRELILGHHPTADLWEIFGDSLATEKSDQHRLLYVAMTRAKQKLYILSADKKSPL